MSEKKRGQHFIPDNSYLRNFAEESGKVWVLNPSGKIYATNPSNIFKEAYFYNIKLNIHGGGSLIIEDTLANIEGAFATIYRQKIAKGINLTNEERANVAIFVAALYRRTKAQREEMRGMFSQLREHLQKWTRIFENNKKARDFSSAMADRKGNGFTADDLDNVLGNLNEYHSVSIVKSLPRIAQIIFDMKWCMMTAPLGHSFITSDNPFQIVRPESVKKYGYKAFGSAPGLLYKDTEITVPLSPTHALLAGWTLEKNGILGVDADMLDQTNYRTMMYARDLVANNRCILEEILVKNPPRQPL